MEERDVSVTADITAVKEDDQPAEESVDENKEGKSLEELKSDLKKAEEEVERLKAEIEKAEQTRTAPKQEMPPVGKTILISMIPEEELEAEMSKEDLNPEAEATVEETPEEMKPEVQVSTNVNFNLCENCGAEFKAGEKFCGYCGSPLQQPMNE